MRLSANAHSRKSAPVRVAPQLRAGHTYNPRGFCLFAISESGPCVESVALACVRKRPQLQAPDAAAPMTNPYPDSNGFARLAYDFPQRLQPLPTMPTDDP